MAGVSSGPARWRAAGAVARAWAPALDLVSGTAQAKGLGHVPGPAGEEWRVAANPTVARHNPALAALLSGQWLDPGRFHDMEFIAEADAQVYPGSEQATARPVGSASAGGRIRAPAAGPGTCPRVREAASGKVGPPGGGEER